MPFQEFFKHQVISIVEHYLLITQKDSFSIFNGILFSTFLRLTSYFSSSFVVCAQCSQSDCSQLIGKYIHRNHRNEQKIAVFANPFIYHCSREHALNDFAPLHLTAILQKVRVDIKLAKSIGNPKSACLHFYTAKTQAALPLPFLPVF